MLKEWKVVGKAAKKSGLFAGGVAFGTVGLKILKSKSAKKGYARVLSTGFKMKDEIDSTISEVKQHADDVYAEAKEMYEKDKVQDSLDLTAEEANPENDEKND